MNYIDRKKTKTVKVGDISIGWLACCGPINDQYRYKGYKSYRKSNKRCWKKKDVK